MNKAKSKKDNKKPIGQFFTTIGSRLGKVKQDEPLNIFSIFLILLLDLFLITVIFTGLYEQVELLTDEYEYAPYRYREIVINNDWNSENQIPKLTQFCIREKNRTRYNDNDNHLEKMHPDAEKLIRKLHKIVANDLLQRQFSKRENLDDILSATIIKEDKNSKKIVIARNNLTHYDNELTQNKEIQSLFKLIIDLKENKSTVLKELRSFNYWYPAKALAFELLFLIPLLAAAIFWNWRMVKREKDLRIFVSSHLITITSIPLLFVTTRGVIKVIPKTFFARLFEILNQIKLISFWYYFLIILSIPIAIGLIYFVQKKLFNYQKLQHKRLMRNRCPGCGRKYHSDGTFCHHCGISKTYECKECGNETETGSKYCKSCGAIQ